MSYRAINIIYLILFIYIAILQIGCEPLPDKENTVPPKENSPAKSTNQQPVSTSIPIFPSLTTDIQACAKNSFTICDPTNNTSYTKCRHRESEQATEADNIITNIYICTHVSAPSLQLIVNSYIYRTPQLKSENALLCDIFANDELVGFSSCTETFCVNKIKEYLIQGFNCQKK